MSDFLGMSDDDFLKQTPPTVGEDAEQEEPHQEEHTEEPVEETEESTGSEEEEQADPEEGTEEESEEETTEGAEQEESEDAEEEATEKQEETATEEDTFGDLSRIKQAFKANGVDVQVKSVDEAISLMQMGANYTKKMQALQPNLKVLKTLEKHDLLAEDKVNYLIDLSKKDPKAISKLVAEAKIDPMDLNTEDVDYTPTNHQVSDSAIQLEQVLEEIQSTPTYSRCVDVVGNQWDEGSRNVLSNDPKLIAQLNEQMQLGIFDKISAEVERVRMFGGLMGMSDFDAYRQVGAQLYKSGALAPKQSEPVKPVAKTEVKQKDTALSQKRKAAATPKANKSPRAPVKEHNPLALSDEEFLKINNIHL